MKWLRTFPFVHCSYRKSIFRFGVFVELLFLIYKMGYLSRVSIFKTMFWRESVIL